jgi:hypothetical protein
MRIAAFLNRYIKNDSETFLNSMVFIYIFLIFLDNVYDFSSFKLLTIAFCIIVFTGLLLQNKISGFEYLTIFIAFALTLWIALIMWRPPLSFAFNRFILLACCGAVIASNGFRSSLSKTLLILQLFIVVYYIFILNYDPEDVLTSSRNSISIHLLAFCLIVYLTDYMEGKIRPVIWPALTVMILCIIANGRSGMIVSILLFMTVLLFNIKHIYLIAMNKYKPNRTILFLFVLFLGIISFIIATYTLPLLIEWFKTSRFNSEGIYSIRFEMWKQYFSELTFKRALFGRNLDQYPITVVRDGVLLIKHSNPHNSFLDLWAKSGFFAFPIFLITILTIWYLKEKSLFLSIIFILFLLRSSTDMVIYLRRSDYVFFAYMFLAFKGTGIESLISNSKYAVNLKNNIEKMRNNFNIKINK